MYSNIYNIYIYLYYLKLLKIKINKSMYEMTVT